MIRHLFLGLLFSLASGVSASRAQTLHLVAMDTDTDVTPIEAALGDTIGVKIEANLGRHTASGLSFYVRLPTAPFEVIDQGDDEEELRPFTMGPLFDSAVEVTNCILPREATSGVSAGQRLLHYTAVLGPSADRSRTGSGLVASFQIVCTATVSEARIEVFSNPVHESRLVLADGHSERRFYPDEGLIVTVDVATATESQTWGIVKGSFPRIR